MAQHDIEITISKSGEVRVHVRGAKGKSCMEYARWLTELIGTVEDQKLTSEYYEPEEKVRIDIDQELRSDD